MTWEDRFIQESELAGYLESSEATFSQRVKALVLPQREHWPLMREGYKAFTAIETKGLSVAEAEVVAQYNPGRIRSTAAAVDQGSVAARPCFLCDSNLPPEEKGIAWRDLVVLCNPYPILANHLSIVDRQHGAQEIKGNARALLELARDLGSEFFALYNGPQCGASAPDHLHFQACSSSLLPIAEHLFDEEPALSEDCSTCEETASNTFELFTLGGCGRTVVVFRGGNLDELEQWIYRVLDELGRLSSSVEPMINIVTVYSNRLWTVYLFPRAAHRPSVYYNEGAEKLTISPGAIDMAGVVVVPERSHFEKLDDATMSLIYREVSFDEEAINQMLDWMTSSEELIW